MHLDGKIALITGAANGIGAATALRLAQSGAHIAVADIEVDTAANTKAGVEKFGKRCAIFTCDVTKAEDIKTCVCSVNKLFGGPDIVIHCAGGTAPGSLLEVDPKVWYNAFDIHIHAAFLLCREAVQFMKSRGEGAIILISSAAGLRGCTGAIAYGVVKGAIPQMVRAMARELADFNIRVNSVAPGIIRTRFQNHLTPQQVKNNLQNRIPLHREGKPEDVAEIIHALVTNEFITGENIVIDGGMSMRMV